MKIRSEAGSVLLVNYFSSETMRFKGRVGIRAGPVFFQEVKKILQKSSSWIASARSIPPNRFFLDFLPNKFIYSPC